MLRRSSNRTERAEEKQEVTISTLRVKKQNFQLLKFSNFFVEEDAELLFEIDKNLEDTNLFLESVRKDGFNIKGYRMKSRMLAEKREFHNSENPSKIKKGQKGDREPPQAKKKRGQLQSGRKMRPASSKKQNQRNERYGNKQLLAKGRKNRKGNKNLGEASRRRDRLNSLSSDEDSVNKLEESTEVISKVDRINQEIRDLMNKYSTAKPSKEPEINQDEEED